MVVGFCFVSTAACLLAVAMCAVVDFGSGWGQLFFCQQPAWPSSDGNNNKCVNKDLAARLWLVLIRI